MRTSQAERAAPAVQTASVETARWDRIVTRTLDEVIGLQFSYSYSSPAQLGDHKDAFEHDLRQALTEFNPDGVFDEAVRTEAIIATRPQPAVSALDARMTTPR